MLFQESNAGNISVIINALSKWNAKYPSLAMPIFVQTLYKSSYITTETEKIALQHYETCRKTCMYIRIILAEKI
ncbi:hypothetical protein Barb4_02061 [Bacteroidales bacterium Barb4]|nr:hypothetical protein Barb4_02061 [Bacteroidales bacterium Barb4]